jgi:hypothetical protein
VDVTLARRCCGGRLPELHWPSSEGVLFPFYDHPSSGPLSPRYSPRYCSRAIQRRRHGTTPALLHSLFSFDRCPTAPRPRGPSRARDDACVAFASSSAPVREDRPAGERRSISAWWRNGTSVPGGASTSWVKEIKAHS